ncbi:hypothetical protein TNCV_3399971 [Trichonephila clavipes]|nr:hypothetical protein TNCV_3399971 [Trichonephila clavipes]
MIFGSSGPRKALPQENYGSISHGSPLKEKITVFTTWLGNIVHLTAEMTVFSDTRGVNVLRRPARSPDLSPIEYEWDIIGRQCWLHPQPELNNFILTNQEQQACNSIPQTDIWYQSGVGNLRLASHMWLFGCEASAL